MTGKAKQVISAATDRAWEKKGDPVAAGSPDIEMVFFDYWKMYLRPRRMRQRELRSLMFKASVPVLSPPL